MRTLTIDETRDHQDPAPTTTRAAAARATSTGAATTSKGSRARVWTGRILSGLTVAFLTFDGVIKLLELPMVIEGTVKVGYPESTIFGIGVLLLACVAIHLIPRTAIVGAVLITGYLGGAIATHVRISDPLFSHTLFPIYVAALLWGGLYLRDSRVRALLDARPR